MDLNLYNPVWDWEEGFGDFLWYMEDSSIAKTEQNALIRVCPKQNTFPFSYNSACRVWHLFLKQGKQSQSIISLTSPKIPLEFPKVVSDTSGSKWSGVSLCIKPMWS